MPCRLNPPITAELICIEKHREICAALQRHMTSREQLYKDQYDAKVLSVCKKYECNKFKVNILSPCETSPFLLTADNPLYLLNFDHK